jgi:hypothetical protein
VPLQAALQQQAMREGIQLSEAITGELEKLAMDARRAPEWVIRLIRPMHRGYRPQLPYHAQTCSICFHSISSSARAIRVDGT